VTDSKEVNVDVEETEIDSEAAMTIVKKNMVWSAGCGFLPIPMVEFVAITAIQIKMIKELSDHYNVPFRKDLAKASVISLLGSLGGVTLGQAVAASSLRVIPIVGPMIATLSLPALSAGASYAIGKVFISHYELGGTLLSFEAGEVRDYFKAKFDEGMKMAGKTKKKATPTEAAA
jgi:uncharacterized protein (DUF697 family)